MNKISKTEDRLYRAMLDIGLRPERQYKISRMKVDFAFPKEMLVIEVDGHYKRNSIGMKTLFERRRACEKEGWKVENFTAEEVFENADSVAKRIYYALKDEARKNKKLDYWKENKKAKNKHIKLRTNIQNIRKIKERGKERQGTKAKRIFGNYERGKKVEKRSDIRITERRKKNLLWILLILGSAIFLFFFLQSQTLSSKFEKLNCQTHFNELADIIGKKMAGMDKNFGISDDPQDYLRVTFYGKWYNDTNHDIIIYFSEEMHLRRAYYNDIKTNKNVKELICNN